MKKPEVVLRNLRLHYFFKIDYNYCYYVTKNINKTSKLVIKLVRFFKPK